MCTARKRVTTSHRRATLWCSAAVAAATRLKRTAAAAARRYACDKVSGINWQFCCCSGLKMSRACNWSFSLKWATEKGKTTAMLWKRGEKTDKRKFSRKTNDFCHSMKSRVFLKVYSRLCSCMKRIKIIQRRGQIKTLLRWAAKYSLTSTTVKLKADGCLCGSITVADPHEASTIRPHFSSLHERPEEVRVQRGFVCVRAAQLQLLDWL